MMRIALPQVDFENVQWQPLAPGARRRVFRQLLYFWLPVIAIVLWWSEDYRTLLLVVVALVFAWNYSYLYVKHTRWGLTTTAVFLQGGWLTRRLIIVPRSRIQSVRYSCSPFDRRHRMASVTVDTAGAARRHFQIDLLDDEVARTLHRSLYTGAPP